MTILAVFCFVVFIFTDLVYFVPLDFTTAEYLSPRPHCQTGSMKLGVNKEYCLNQFVESYY